MWCCWLFFFLFFLFGTWLNLSLTFYWGGCPKTRRRQWHPTPVLLPGKSHGWRSLVGWSPWGHKESDTTERLHFHFSLSRIGEGNGNPLQCSCPENPRDGGAWWAAIYGVSQNRTWLKRLSSSSSSSSKTVIHRWLLLMVESKTRSCWFVLCLCVLSALVMFNFATLWTVARQAPLPMGFFLQEYCSGLPFPSPGNLLDPGIKLTSPVLAGGFFFTTVATWEAPFILRVRTPDSFNHLYNSLESGPMSALQSCYSSNNCIHLASLVLGLSSLSITGITEPNFPPTSPTSSLAYGKPPSIFFSNTGSFLVVFVNIYSPGLLMEQNHLVGVPNVWNIHSSMIPSWILLFLPPLPAGGALAFHLPLAWAITFSMLLGVMGKARTSWNPCQGVKSYTLGKLFPALSSISASLVQTFWI